MINILPKKADDIIFTRIVTEILASLVEQHSPKKVFVVHVDRRFDFKWKGFKGKFLGAVGAWNDEQLRIPPFNPKKILDERHFERSDTSYVELSGPRLHIHQRSEFNHERRIDAIGDSSIFLWYSGETLVHPHASIMVYSIDNTEQSSWFISFIHKHTWRIMESLGISEQEARYLFEKMPVSV